MNEERYWQMYREFAPMARSEGRFNVFDNSNICLNDDRSQNFDPHYTLHTAWAARRIAERKPEYHVDISSCMRFVTLVSAFVPVKAFDFRAVHYPLSNIESGDADLCNLHFADNCIDSLSCLHTIEHIGLGRYGDPLDAAGDRKAAAHLARVLKPGGQLLIAFPMGNPRIYYNAHRIYSFEMALDLFRGLRLQEFSMISLRGSEPEYSAKGWKPFEFMYDIHPGKAAELVALENHPCGACGCLRFTK